MPRRDSRAQLVHLLSRDDALTYALMHGPAIPPAAFYDNYRRYSISELREMAADLAPRRRGRPKRRSRYADLSNDVDEVLRSGRRKSERGACSYVADKAGVSAEMLRKIRRATKRPN